IHFVTGAQLWSDLKSADTSNSLGHYACGLDIVERVNINPEVAAWLEIQAGTDRLTLVVIHRALKQPVVHPQGEADPIGEVVGGLHASRRAVAGKRPVIALRKVDVGRVTVSRLVIHERN